MSMAHGGTVHGAYSVAHAAGACSLHEAWGSSGARASSSSGMWPYLCCASRRSYDFRRSAEYTPAPPFSSCRSFSVRRFSPASRRARASATPAGMTGGRAVVSRALGIATWMRLSTSLMRLPATCVAQQVSGLSTPSSTSRRGREGDPSSGATDTASQEPHFFCNSLDW